MRKYSRYFLSLLFLIINSSAFSQNIFCNSDFSFSQNGNSASFTNNSTASSNIISYQWGFGDGNFAYTANPTHTYSQAGTYGICLYIETADSCFSSHCDTITVQGGGGGPGCGVTLNTVQINNSSFQYAATLNSGTITSFLWDFGDGSFSSQANPTHAYANAGAYAYCLTVTTSNNCTATLCDTIVALAGCGTCQAGYTYTISGPTITFTDVSTASNTINSWYWDFGDGSFSFGQNPAHAYAATGTYPICLTITTVDSCVSTYCDSIYVQCGSTPTCQANFTSWTDSLGNAYFNDQSTASSQIQGWYWDFGDGSFSSQQYPNHTYQPGSYIACLTIFTADSCSSTYCDSVVVNPPCNCGNASFNYTVSGNTVTFTNTSPGCYVTSGWTFGNGSSSSLTNPTITYAGPGSYNVCLCIYDGNGNLCDIVCQTVVIGGGCNVSTNFSSISNGNNVSFTNLTTGAGPGFSYDWHFGDGNSSSATNPTHTYANPGTYSVCLIAYDSLWTCYDSICNTVTVTGCAANSAFSIYTSGNYGYFQQNNPSPSNTNQWYVNYSPVGNAANLSYTFPGPGTYNVCLEVYDSLSNCFDSTCVPVTIAPCNISANFQSYISGTYGYFQSQVTGNPNFLHWTVDYQSAGNGSNLNYTFPSAGTYNVCLYAEDTLTGCYDSTCTTVTVTACTANSGFSTYTSGNYGYFQQNNPNPNNTNQWYVNYSPVGNATNLSYTFPGPGTYNVCLEVYDSLSNCYDSTCVPVTIAPCNISANFQSFVSGNNGYFQSQVTGNPTFLHWTVDYQSAGNGSNLSYTFPGAGTYNVCLYAEDTLTGCYDSTCTTVNIGQGCNLNAAFNYGVAGNTVIFQNQTTGAQPGTTYYWYFGDGSFSNAVNPTHQYSGAGTYSVVLAVDDTVNNCFDSTSVVITLTGPGRSNGGSVIPNWGISSFPNPTVDVNNLKYELLEDSPVTIRVFDTNGQVIEVLLENEKQTAGEHQVEFNAANLPAGMYLYDVRAGEERHGVRFVKE